MAVMIAVNGTDFPLSGEYNLTSFDIVTNEIRSPTNALLKADWVAQKRKIEVSYPLLSKAEMTLIKSLIKPGTKAGFFFTTVYIDHDTGEPVSGTFYSSDIKTGTFKFNSSTGVIQWKDVKFSLIEK